MNGTLIHLPDIDVMEARLEAVDKNHEMGDDARWDLRSMAGKRYGIPALSIEVAGVLREIENLSVTSMRRLARRFIIAFVCDERVAKIGLQTVEGLLA